MTKFISKKSAEEVANLYKAIGYKGLNANEIRVSIRNNEDGSYSVEVKEKDIWDLI